VGEPVDRRGFIAAGLGAGALLVAGCGDTAARRPARRASVRRATSSKLSGAIRGHVFERGSPGFRAAARVYNRRFDAVLPDAVARPVDARDVRDAVRWALGSGTRVRARSGGHSYAGYSTLEHGVVLDLRKLNHIQFDRRRGIASVGAGAQMIDVLHALAPHGATLPTGSCPSVGVSGVTLGGGMGLAGRAFGLTCDHLAGAQIVTPDGRLREADRELLWGLRGGGGGNFGIVTRFDFKVRPLPGAASYFFVSWPWSSVAEAVVAWLAWAPHADSRATSILHLNAGGDRVSVGASGQYLGPPTDLDRGLLAPLTGVEGALVSTGSQDYLGLQLRWAGCLTTPYPACHTAGSAPHGALPRESFEAKSDYLARPLSGAAAEGLAAALEARAARAGSGAVLFDAYGGAIGRVAPNATAFVHRDPLCAIQYLTYEGDDGWLNSTWRSMRPHVSGMAYQNYIDPALPDWAYAYYGANLRRLRELRREVDPHRFFAFPQGID
jgi:FAD/FMN-containing dehydrogenase